MVLLPSSIHKEEGRADALSGCHVKGFRDVQAVLKGPGQRSGPTVSSTTPSSSWPTHQDLEGEGDEGALGHLVHREVLHIEPAGQAGQHAGLHLHIRATPIQTHRLAHKTVDTHQSSLPPTPMCAHTLMSVFCALKCPTPSITPSTPPPHTQHTHQPLPHTYQNAEYTDAVPLKDFLPLRTSVGTKTQGATVQLREGEGHTVTPTSGRGYRSHLLCLPLLEGTLTHPASLVLWEGSRGRFEWYP